jgi:hypothetical protein
LFIQGSGSQTKIISWTDSGGNTHVISTLYDGGSIGAFNRDNSRNFTGSFGITYNSGVIRDSTPTGVFKKGTSYSYAAGIGGAASYDADIDSSLSIPADSGPNKPGSLSLKACITY